LQFGRQRGASIAISENSLQLTGSGNIWAF
jgi:hypothetical protein